MRTLRAGVLVATALIITACASATNTTSTTSPVGRGVQVLDVQRQLVRAVTIELIKMNQMKQISGAELGKIKLAYGRWVEKHNATAEALVQWKTIASQENELKLINAFKELQAETEKYLTLAARWVNIEELQRRLGTEIDT